MDKALEEPKNTSLELVAELAFYREHADYLGFTLTEDQVKDLVSMDTKFDRAGFPGFMVALRRIMTLSREDPDELRLVGVIGQPMEVIAERKNPLARLIERLTGTLKSE